MLRNCNKEMLDEDFYFGASPYAFDQQLCTLVHTTQKSLKSLGSVVRGDRGHRLLNNLSPHLSFLNMLFAGAFIFIIYFKPELQLTQFIFDFAGSLNTFCKMQQMSYENRIILGITVVMA